MQAGVSTACFYPELTEVAFDYLVDGGVKTLEIFLNCKYETTPEFLAPLKEKAEKNNVKITSLHPYTSGEEGRYFFSLYPRRFQEGRELYQMYYDACNFLNADSLVFHGDRFLSIDDDEYFKRVKIIHQDAKNQGVELCLENVYRFRSHSPKLFQNVRKVVPDIKCVIDVKQATLAGYEADDFISAMGIENIHHVHLSDHNSTASCMLPGKGDFDIKAMLTRLYKSGFRGAVLIELYRSNYAKYSQLIESYNSLEKMIEEIKKG